MGVVHVRVLVCAVTPEWNSENSSIVIPLAPSAFVLFFKCLSYFLCFRIWFFHLWQFNSCMLDILVISIQISPPYFPQTLLYFLSHNLHSPPNFHFGNHWIWLMLSAFTRNYTSKGKWQPLSQKLHSVNRSSTRGEVLWTPSEFMQVYWVENVE